MDLIDVHTDVRSLIYNVHILSTMITVVIVTNLDSILKYTCYAKNIKIASMSG